MRVTFLIPPAPDKRRVPERVFGCSYGLYPIPHVFILTFASILRNAGHQVEVIDAPIIRLGINGFFKILSGNPRDCYIFYSVNLSKELDISTAKQIRELNNGAAIIFCGPTPTFSPGEFLFSTNVYSVRGEPDYTLKELIQSIEHKDTLSNVGGITYLEREKILSTPARALIENLDELPFPARDLIDRDRYYNPKFGIRPFTAVMTARGCPYSCKFCVPSSLTFARKIEYQRENGIEKIPHVSFRSAPNVISEFEFLKSEGYKAVSIIDDEFALKKDRVMEICDGIKKLNISWGCLARSDHLLDETVVRKMGEAGCRYIDIGVESFQQEILDDIRKNLKVETVKRAVLLLKRHRIEPKLNILVAASPLETKKTIKDTINQAMKLKPGVIMFNICNPFPGTELYQIAKSKGWFTGGDYCPVDVQKESVIEFPHLKKDEIEKATRRANRKFFLRPALAFTNFIKIRNFKEFYGAVKSLVVKFRN